jgi:hypothetical protein
MDEGGAIGYVLVQGTHWTKHQMRRAFLQGRSTLHVISADKPSSCSALWRQGRTAAQPPADGARLDQYFVLGDGASGGAFFDSNSPAAAPFGRLIDGAFIEGLLVFLLWRLLPLYRLLRCWRRAAGKTSGI